MSLASSFSDIARSPGDPTIISTGPSSRGASDNMAKQLGYLSLALGAAEIFAPGRITRVLGMEGKEALVRAYGFREVAAGITCLSTEERTGVWSRVAGDALDIGTLLTAYRDNNPKKHNVGLALMVVAGITILDLVTAQALNARHGRSHSDRHDYDYSDRSGWPNGLSAARGAAADFEVPADMRAIPASAASSPTSGRTSPASANLS